MKRTKKQNEELRALNTARNVGCGHTGGEDGQDLCVYRYIGLTDGRRLHVFLNTEANLLVVDIVDANGRGGCEVVRRTI